MQRNLHIHSSARSFLYVFLATVLCVTPLSAQEQCNAGIDYFATDSNQVVESFDQLTLVGYDATGEEFGRTRRQLVGNDLLISYEGGGTDVQAACSLWTGECVVSENGQVLEDGVLGPGSSQLVNRLESQSVGLLRGLPSIISGSVGLEVECDTCWGSVTFTNAEGETYTVPVPYLCNCRVKLKVDINFGF